MSDFQFSLPLLFLCGGAIAVMFAGTKKASPTGPSPLAPGLAALATLCALISMMALQPGGKGRHFQDFALADSLGFAVGQVLLVATFATIILAGDYLKKAEANFAEFYALLLFCAAGMVVMVTTDHLVTLFLGLEIMSLALYVLSAFVRRREAAIEAGAKYFLAGSFASGLFIMGIALLYGATGHLDVATAAALIGKNGLASTGFALLLAGFAFKLSLVPFHQWAADVYEGAATPVTGFMSTAVKVAGFTAFFRFVANPAVHEFGEHAMGWLAGITMIVGNVGALMQKSIKRMLAFSSIGHAGYLMLGPVAWNGGGSPALESVVFYLVAYTLTNILAFGVIGFLETAEGKGVEWQDITGLRWRQPVMAVCLCIAMLSLSGAPPTAGFLAKFRLFGAVIDRASVGDSTMCWLLVTIAVITSLISLGFYLRVIVEMYMKHPTGPEPVRPKFSPAYTAAVMGLAALVLWLGFGPTIFGVGVEGLFGFAKAAVGSKP